MRDERGARPNRHATFALLSSIPSGAASSDTTASRRRRISRATTAGAASHRRVSVANAAALASNHSAAVVVGLFKVAVTDAVAFELMAARGESRRSTGRPTICSPGPSGTSFRGADGHGRDRADEEALPRHRVDRDQ